MAWKSVLGKVVGCPGKFGDVTLNNDIKIDNGEREIATQKETA
jgi:hypothetical protein